MHASQSELPYGKTLRLGGKSRLTTRHVEAACITVASLPFACLPSPPCSPPDASACACRCPGTAACKSSREYDLLLGGWPIWDPGQRQDSCLLLAASGTCQQLNLIRSCVRRFGACLCADRCRKGILLGAHRLVELLHVFNEKEAAASCQLAGTCLEMHVLARPCHALLLLSVFQFVRNRIGTCGTFQLCMGQHPPFQHPPSGQPLPPSRQGRGWLGELGTGQTSTVASAPTPVASDLAWSQIAAGHEFTCGISGNRAYCWVGLVWG